VLRSVSSLGVTATTVEVDAIAGYSPYVPEVNISATIAAITADMNINLPDAALAKGQVINIRITDTAEPVHNFYLNINGPGLITYGAMPYQGWVVKSDGTNWAVVGRN